MKYIPYGKQNIDEEDIQSVVEVLMSDFLTQGPKIDEFEEKLAEFCGAKYAVLFNSGTAALHAAYFSIGLSKGDEFITTPITFVATANAGVYLGAKPVFVDIEKDTGNIDAGKIEDKISDRTKLIVPVHYAGHPCDMKKIKEIADKYNLKVVEDGCHALGAEYIVQCSSFNVQGSTFKVGSCQFSDMTVFSFHPVKHITTGEGGAVLTNKKEYYEKLLIFRTHGITRDVSKFKAQDSASEGDWYYEMQCLGYNYRMTDIQAALGMSQLKKLDNFVERRRQIAKKYYSIFKELDYFDLPEEKVYAHHSYHLYHVRLKDKYVRRKVDIFRMLRGNGVGVQVHYIPVYWQPFYEELGFKKGICTDAEDFYRREISLPIYPAMTDEDVDFVASKIDEVFRSL
ncbi:UDP-4-keto-6-deoxy-N-acetylglucosamine 4-aminotransferase [Calditerrivibrio nitroreducens DSM 19672]|uniref:UDP-4-keto-6-deoxy-N-acetylglucosamine 4-aminotransferase n=2 Tax=Calditerrivibrio nitroreducens TaxID=477976 RepID=E4TGE0_CALNY|nr:UDP-4-keto-6-deoxy-N-acetylglucosamine 4-aminotransferase [Calditerrivibrio nitroreducens DSM 19672]